MQTVLSIDATREPALAVVAQVDGSKVSILEAREVSFENRFSRSTLLGESHSQDPQSGESSGQDQEPQTAEPLVFETPFTNALVIVPPHDHLSMNVALPFNDQKRLSKLIEPEVQDLVPFETDEFVLQHSPTGLQSGGNFDIHISAVPKKLIRSSLLNCHERGVDPLALSTPSAVLNALADIHPQPLAPNSLIVFCRGGPGNPFICCLSFRKNGMACAEQTIQISDNSVQAQGDQLYHRIRVALGSFEKQQSCEIEHVYLVGEELDRNKLSGFLQRSVTVLRLSDFIESSPPGGELAVLGALFAEDNNSQKVLTNFRIGEFAFRPPLKELLGALKSLAPFLLGLLILTGIYLGGSYLVTDVSTTRIERQIAEQIRKAAPSLALVPGKELESLSAETAKIDDQLKDLGSPESYSPLDALAQITEGFPGIQDVSVDKINVRANKIKLEGCAPDYRAIEQIESELKKQKAFGTVKKQAATSCPSGQANSRGFTFEVWVRD